MNKQTPQENQCPHGYRYGECPDDVDGICVWWADNEPTPPYHTSDWKMKLKHLLGKCLITDHLSYEDFCQCKMFDEDNLYEDTIKFISQLEQEAEQRGFIRGRAEKISEVRLRLALMKSEHHEGNMQRGCIECVEQGKINKAIDEVLSLNSLQL